MPKLKMSVKQAFGALYAIEKYLDEADNRAVTMGIKPGDAYDRGYRAGMCKVVDAITKIINNYNTTQEAE